MAQAQGEDDRDRLDRILDLYGDAGIPAFPLRCGSKLPQFAKWTRRATADLQGMYRCFSHFPGCNVGLAMGSEFRPGEFCFALDVDPRHGGNASLRKLLKSIHLPALPATAEALTGGGGRHYVMTAPRPVPCGRLAGDFPGLDIKGIGGYVAVEPSIHPGLRKKEYVWVRTPKQGVAPAPERLIALLPCLPIGPPGPPRALTVGHARPDDGSPPGRPEASRSGDATALWRDLADRFPVAGPGQRHRAMCRAIASLVGRGFPDATIRATMVLWDEHFRALGRARTRPDLAHAEIERCLASTRGNGRFARALGGIDHHEACHRIRLAAGVVERIRTGAFMDPSGAGEAHGGGAGCKGVTRSNAYKYDGWPLSEREFAFVEAVVVHAVHVLGAAASPLIRLTDGQIAAIAADRHPDVRWSPQQMAREKRKFLSRPGQPATRFGLLEEASKGRRAGDSPGVPSTYRATGILGLLGDVPSTDSAEDPAGQGAGPGQGVG